VFIVLVAYFVVGSVRKFLDTPTYLCTYKSITVTNNNYGCWRWW